ncbi:MAG: DM13 domain-containing protein [Acidimicrobiia bacterium]
MILVIVILIIFVVSFILFYFEPQAALLSKTGKEKIIGEKIEKATWKSREHKTTGTVFITKKNDVEFVRFENLSTTNGPDLKVYLATNIQNDGTPVEFIDLGDLKANKGNSNYKVPGNVDLSSYKYVVIWCKRFSVSFADARLDMLQN